MTAYLISFPSEALVLTDEEFPIVAAESRAVIEEAKAAGVYVYGGGIDEKLGPVLVTADGSVSAQTYPDSELTGGFTILELSTREEAVEWARKIAAACRCPQELREFMYDPGSYPTGHLTDPAIVDRK
ncbi:transcription initiation protein [Cryobacterium frigoriphilum]|uniref:Transcription initiation protein n=1 Tax=Cryobacterium frigoriphilum TaxID=1259150 RepID=A0A4V3IRX3_9MICO|nr:YciI family protein [Cryobacterium frigoriphilum]TFD54013.1 transcription initiation protein [Cryobacterium frigoriphilum]